MFNNTKTSNVYSILVVDDEPINRQILREILKDSYKLFFATDGQKAIEVAHKMHPDIILLDIMMPNMDGIETCLQLKKDKKTVDIPVIFISALHGISEKINAFKSGGIDYICKPFQSEEVIARVETHLKIYYLQRELKYKNQTLMETQQELVSLNQQLENRVKEEVNKRRRDEQMLIQQSKMASAGEMIGSIAHQWKQPLNALGIIIQDFEDAYDCEELDSSYIRSAVRQSMGLIELMSNTVDDFRNFLKPSKEKKKFNVLKAINEVFNLFSDQLKKSGIDIKIEAQIDYELYTYGYNNEFKQVILNLINNSRDAINTARYSNPDYKGRIIVEIKPNEVKNMLLILIKDNGGGIENSVLETLFDPYITTKGEKGTGIGLHMSKAIIEDNMNGKIVASNKDGGAEFVIELPCD